jgi:glycosyltransferase involved in cell wall biosynthesis
MENNNPPLKIIHVISTLVLGGAETFVVNLANEQVKKHDVTVLTYKPFDVLKSHESNLNSQIKRLSILCKKKYSLLLVWQMYRAFKKSKADVIHMHLHSSLYHVFIVSLFYRKPVYIHTIHSELHFWKKIFQFLSSVSFLHNRIGHICISPKIYNQFYELFPKLHFYQISNGIAPYAIKRSKAEVESDINNKVGQKRFLIIANLSKVKNLVLAASVFRQLSENKINADLLIIGEDRDINLAVTHEILSVNANNVFLMGAKHAAPDYLQVCEALIISSLNEGMPIVALEALSMGKPIITTPAGGMTDIITDGYNGCITKSFETEEFYEAILRFLHLSDNEKQIMGHNAFQSYERNYRISHTAKEYEELYIKYK